MSRQARFLRLNAVVYGLGNHEAAWRMPESDPLATTSLAHWAGLARIAEEAGFDSLFLGDVLALLQGAERHLSDTMDPLVILSALAAVTSRIGLIGTLSTSFEPPFHIARRFASLDHITGGRAGWNIVTSSNRLEAGNFGLDGLPAHAGRYAMASDVLDATIALWDSWDADARVADNGDVVFFVHSDVPGAAMNRAPGDTLHLADGALYPSLGALAAVASDGLGGGADIEDDESLRARVLDRKRRPPQGGAYSDYEQFARKVPGVVKAWAWPFADGPGTVGVWFLFAGRSNLIPSAPDIIAVREELESRRLIRAGLSVSAPLPMPVAITIAGLGRDTDEVRFDIEASLAAMFLDRAKPGVAVEPFVLSRSWIGEAISKAAGEDRHVLAEPLTDLVFTDGQYPVLGEVTYA